MSNAFHIMDSQHEEEVGVAVYGLPSLLNHSCDPNTVAVFSGSTICIRSIKTLSPGDEVDGIPNCLHPDNFFSHIFTLLADHFLL